MSDALSRTHLAIGLFIYIVSGVLQPVFIDYLRLNNLLGHKFLLLPTLANVSGMALCGLLGSKKSWKSFHSAVKRSGRLRNMILLTVLVDLLSGMCLTFGILLTGGAIFVILYNSCPAWTALLSRFVLGKKLNAMQVMGVFFVCAGLILNVFGSQAQLKGGKDQGVDENQDSNDAKAHIIVLGSIIVLVGSLLHSLMYVLSDMSMTSFHPCDELGPEGSKKGTPDLKNTTISGEVWSCCLGSLETVFMTVWVSVGILIYGFDDNSLSVTGDKARQDEHLPSYNSIFYGFLGLTAIDALHAAAFFTLLKNLGAVASALLKGVQAIVVVALSAIFYCPTEKSQCLTWMKSISAVIVLSGVMGYGVGSKKKDPNGSGGGRINSHSRLYESDRGSNAELLELSTESRRLMYGCE